ncbi:MAG: hypothetical protein ACKO5A_08035 [Actinomycetota bacterium]
MTGGRPQQLEDLRDLVASLEPVVPAHERVLPVDPAVASLFPFGGLRRGTTLWIGGTAGATTLALGLIAGPTRQGSWVGALSVASVGWAAAAQLGVDLHRLAVVRADGPDWTVAAAALVDAFDIVLFGPDHRPARRDVLRIAARARERGTVVVAFGGTEQERAWPGSDLRLHIQPDGTARWHGVGRGWGRLIGRRLQVTISGRHGVDRPRVVELWSPGPAGVLDSPVTAPVTAPVDQPRRDTARILQFPAQPA